MQHKTIAFVLYPGLTMLDLIGPLQVFTAVQEPYQTVVVGEHTNPMPVNNNIIQFSATHTFADVPSPAGIIMPGGGMPTIRAMANRAIREYLLANADSTEFIGSVCTGSLILAAAGLLEGRRATTHWGYAPELEAFGATYVPERWVEDGKFITAAGVSAGIDMGLALLGRLFGEDHAKSVQLGLEYDPEPPFGPIDWTGVRERVIPPSKFNEQQRQAFKDALAEMPELYDRLMGQ